MRSDVDALVGEVEEADYDVEVLKGNGTRSCVRVLSVFGFSESKYEF